MDIGKVLLIANPVSQSGQGRQAASLAGSLLKPHLGGNLQVVFTEAPKHAVSIAREAAGFDTVIALGGDGVIHEVANGLMSIDAACRPRLGILPIGSGNDYARSLNITRSDISASVNELLARGEKRVDVGLCNGEYFLETLSFGLDAAIAIETMELRKTTSKTETALYFDAGVNQILHHFDTYYFDALIDGKTKLHDGEITFAIQVGPTYGGGFLICPDAKIDDGVFDICYSQGPQGRVRTLYVFAKAKKGQHLKYDFVKHFQASTIDLKFDRRPPCQVDGEVLLADEYHISLCPLALRVIC